MQLPNTSKEEEVIQPEELLDIFAEAWQEYKYSLGEEDDNRGYQKTDISIG